ELFARRSTYQIAPGRAVPRGATVSRGHLDPLALIAEGVRRGACDGILDSETSGPLLRQGTLELARLQLPLALARWLDQRRQFQAEDAGEAPWSDGFDPRRLAFLLS